MTSPKLEKMAASTRTEVEARGTHTPGPWEVREHNFADTRRAHGIFGADKSLIAEQIWGRSLDQSDANARLIAAAPVLLAVAVAVAAAEDYDSIEAAKELARAAIAKAEGREP